MVCGPCDSFQIFYHQITMIASTNINSSKPEKTNHCFWAAASLHLEIINWNGNWSKMLKLTNWQSFVFFFLLFGKIGKRMEQMCQQFQAYKADMKSMLKRTTLLSEILNQKMPVCTHAVFQARQPILKLLVSWVPYNFGKLARDKKT